LCLVAALKALEQGGFKEESTEIAGINGKLRPEYFEILVNKAMDFGMEREEAERYIKDYCRRKKWTVETAPDKRRRNIIAAAAAAVLVVVCAAAGAFYYIQHQQALRESAYEQMIAQVGKKDSPADKIAVLQAFINNHSSRGGYGRYIEKAEKRVTRIRNSMAESRYREFSAGVERLAADGRYRAAIEECRQYLAQNPDKTYARRAENRITELQSRIEQQDLARLKQIMINGSTPEKIEAIADYRKQYPHGAHLEEVNQMLSEISGEYYIYVRNQLEVCENNRDWQRCADLCEHYIDRYDNSYADKLKPRLEAYQEKIKQNRILAALRKKAASRKNSPRAASCMYMMPLWHTGRKIRN